MRYLIALLISVVFGYGLAHGQISLEGTWELKSFVDHGTGDVDWTKNPTDILYQKHISADHFTWVKFDLKTNTLLGMGGGSYSIDAKGRYVENLDFFYPPGSSELGQTIPFDVQRKGKEWLHTGYAKVFDIGLEGENIVVDSSKIQEIWKPVKAPKTKSELVGAWELVKYLDNPESGYMVYPDIIGYIKILTATHFVWVKFDKEGDQIYAAGSGTYSVSESGYSEKILMQYPDTQLIGEVIPFDKELSGNQWKHYGYLQTPTGEKDIIDEFWRPLILSQTGGNFDLK